MIIQNKKAKSINSKIKKSVPIILLLITAVSGLTTIGIIFPLLTETITFFQRVPFWVFFPSTDLNRFGKNRSFGLLQLITGSAVTSLIAIYIAAPLVLMLPLT